MKRKKTLISGVCLLTLAALAVLIPVLGSASAENMTADSLLARQLESQGIAAVDVRLKDDVLDVTLPSTKGGSPEDTWARVVAKREASFLAAEGELAAAYVGTTIVDETGAIIYYGDGPIEARPRPVAADASKVDLSRSQKALSAEATANGVELEALGIAADAKQGLIVDAKTRLTEANGEKRDLQLQWSTLELLGLLREQCEKSEGLDVDIYRLTITDPSGAVVVSYVVDTKGRSAHAWLAPGYQPVWSMSRPYSPPTDVSAKD